MALPSIPQAPNLPAHLARFGNLGLSLNESITGGMKTGGQPSIGIKQAKWRLREGAAEELVNSFTLDVIIVNANKHLSKVFYAGAYTGEEGKAPDCYSDNGQGPSAQAGSPQSQNCATCPHNVWGSKISPSGAKTKACSDYKKLAVVLADDPERNVYELRIPGASLKDLNTIMTKLINNRVPVPAVVFQLSFDSTVDYPKVLFKPTGYVDEEQATAVERWINSEEAKTAVGEGDVVPQAAIAAPAAAPAPALPPKPVAQPAPAPKQEDPMAFMNAPTQEQPKRRGRPAKNPEPSQGVAAAPAGNQLNLDLPGGQAAAQATPINPQVTDESLDQLLAGIL